MKNSSFTKERLIYSLAKEYLENVILNDFQGFRCKSILSAILWMKNMRQLNNFTLHMRIDKFVASLFPES